MLEQDLETFYWRNKHVPPTESGMYLVYEPDFDWIGQIYYEAERKQWGSRNTTTGNFRYTGMSNTFFWAPRPIETVR